MPPIQTDRPLSGFLIIDKPEGVTSHQVIGRLRRLLSFRRIGHTGTLDPMATGVLPILIGRATRASDYIMDGEKTYEAVCRLGITTDTQDSTGQTLTEWPGELPCLLDIQAVLPDFLGDIEQIPPMVSAIKIGGRKLYELHRKGVEIERPARRVVISELSVSQQRDEYQLRITCSKGTYVRTLIHDIGQALGCGAVMTGLRRTAAAPFSIAQAVTLEQVEQAVKDGTFFSVMRTIDKAFSARPAVYVDAAGETLIRHGVAVARAQTTGETDVITDERLRVYGPGGFLMLGMFDSEGNLRCEKSFYEVTE